jgi:fibronectin type 3 domain-containing protein
VNLRPIAAALVLVLILAPGLLAQQSATTTETLRVTHAGILTWNASTSTVTGYNVYRGTTSGGPYTLLAAVNSLTFTDTTVIAGTTYFWVVTALDNTLESVYSNEVSGTIPSP